VKLIVWLGDAEGKDVCKGVGVTFPLEVDILEKLYYLRKGD